MRLLCVCCAVLGMGDWALCLAQIPGGQGAGSANIPGQNPNGIQIYLRAGLQARGPGQHDYAQFLADWSKFLPQRGAVVTGPLLALLAQELKNIAVLAIDKGDAGYLSDADRAALEDSSSEAGASSVFMMPRAARISATSPPWWSRGSGLTSTHSPAVNPPGRSCGCFGYNYDSFDKPEIQNMLLCAIAWDSKHPLAEVVDCKPPPAVS